MDRWADRETFVNKHWTQLESSFDLFWNSRGDSCDSARSWQIFEIVLSWNIVIPSAPVFTPELHSWAEWLQNEDDESPGASDWRTDELRVC